MLTRNQMIEFIATVDEKPVEQVKTMLTSFETDEIEPLVETMIVQSKDKIRERIAIAI